MGEYGEIYPSLEGGNKSVGSELSTLFHFGRVERTEGRGKAL